MLLTVLISFFSDPPNPCPCFIPLSFATPTRRQSSSFWPFWAVLSWRQQNPAGRAFAIQPWMLAKK